MHPVLVFADPDNTSLINLPLTVQVTKAKIWVEQKPWTRMTVDNEPHDHGVRLSIAAAVPVLQPCLA